MNTLKITSWPAELLATTAANLSTDMCRIPDCVKKVRLASSGCAIPIKVAVRTSRIPALDGCAPAFTEH